ncbi:MAG: RNA polymerase sigma factor [Clostridiaceae bacterium]|nr:RNA polymerase sigma factor [Clostridiaceae bacterium]
MEKEFQQMLYEQYYRDVFRSAYYIVGNKELAKDLTNEAYLKAFDKIDTLKDVGKFKSWICIIATNLAKTQVVQEKKIVISDDLAMMHITKETPEDIIIEQLDSQHIKHSLKIAMEQLDLNSKEVILLRYYHNLSYKDMSSTLSIKEGTVKSRLKRAKDKLHTLLSKGGV